MEPLRPLASEDEEIAFVKEGLNRADFWVTSGHFDIPAKYHVKSAQPSFEMVRLPELWFRAFHPDIVYARQTSTGALTTSHYNSAIAAWCYKHQVEKKKTLELFNADIFAKLGYFSRWDQEVLTMKERFAGCDVDFAEFFLSVKRRGAFMHSVNHPKAFALVEVAKRIALQMGAPRSILNHHFEIGDALLGAAWPLYDEIAKFYSLEGDGYKFLISQKYYVGLPEYVDFCFDAYRKQGIAPSDLSLFTDETALDRVLAPHVGAMS